MTIDDINSFEEAEEYIIRTLDPGVSNKNLSWLDDSVKEWFEELQKLQTEFSHREDKNINQYKVNRAITLSFLIQKAVKLYDEMESMYYSEDEYDKLDRVVEDAARFDFK